MTRTEGLKAARELVTVPKGSEFYCEENDRGPRSQEEFESRREEQKSAIAAEKASREALEQRRAAVLKADAEYQRLMSAWKTAKKTRESFFLKLSPRVTVGHSENLSGLFRHVHSVATGFNWSDVVRRLREKAKGNGPTREEQP